MDSLDFPTTETGDAEYFAAQFGDRVKYDHRQGRWLIFHGHRWQVNDSGELHRLAVDAMRRRQRDVAKLENPEEKRLHYKWAIGGESRMRIDNLIALARNIKPISDSGAGWDADPWLLGVTNGVLDIRTGLLRDGEPEDRMTMMANAAYDPDATCPEWEAMMTRVFQGDPELMLYVQCALGYSITGITHEQCLFMNTGNGANGKGTTLGTVHWLLGDYADNLKFESLLVQPKGVISNDIAKLVGKRFVMAGEPKKGMTMDDARIKQLTGCDPITARFLYHEDFTYQPVAKFWLSCNELPGVDDSSHGYWRRMRVIPWNSEFGGATDDKELKERLKREADGILRWLVDGCIHGWRAMGLTVPQAIQDATAAYRRESHALTPFLDERCLLGATGRVGAGQLYREYLDWAADQPGGKWSQVKFGMWAKGQFKVEVARHVTTYSGVSIQQQR